MLESRSVQDLKAKIRAGLPKEAFQPHPKRGLIFFVYLSLIFSLIYLLIHKPLPWYLALLTSLCLGNVWGAFSFYAHEVLHGSVFRSSKFQNLVGYFAFSIFCFSPAVWKTWHNVAHHVHTNDPDQDPEVITQKHIQNFSLLKYFKWLLPVGPVQNFISLFYGISLEGQVILWHYTNTNPLFKKLNRLRFRTESILMFAGWILLSVLMGFKITIWVVLIPMAMANFIGLSYAVTNHALRPLEPKKNVFNNSMSVKTHPIIDILHLNASHHIEHHLFPKMNWKYFPEVRKMLKNYAGDQYLCPKHGRALATYLRVPHIYITNHMVGSPYSKKRFDLRELVPTFKN